jgi:hypothetical protein
MNEDLEDEDFNAWMKATEAQLDQARPSVYASGADLRYGLRVVAGYNDRVIFFSIPPDPFHGIADTNHDVKNKVNGEDANALREPNSVSEGPITIQGCYVDTVEGLIDLAVHSGPEMAVYAFSSSGIVKVYQLDGTTSWRGSSVVKKSFGENGQVLGQRAGGECGWYAGGFPTWDRNLSEFEEERQTWESVASLEKSCGALDCEVVL